MTMGLLKVNYTLKSTKSNVFLYIYILLLMLSMIHLFGLYEME